MSSVKLGTMTSALERQCTLLIHQDIAPEDADELKKHLESGDLESKAEALKRAISMQLSGEPVPGMLMMVIRYILPHEDTHLRKLGLYYLEIVDKHGPDGKMLPEMILVCNMIRNELVHPNEYTRGCALRFVCKIHDAEILEPLIPSIRQNLEHRHSFVRRNAVLAVHTIFEKFEFLIPDAPELVEEFLAEEGDLAAKRNAFVMLCQSDQDRGVNYLNNNIQHIPMWGETLQLSALELVRRVCRANPLEKGQYIKIIFVLLQSPSAAVVYESANTLISLSSAPTAIRAAAQCYCQLLATQSDNNIKLILLDRIVDLRKSQSAVLQELVMDIMRALQSPNMDIRRKTIDLAMDVITRRNVEEVVGVLRKELVKTMSAETSQEKDTVSQYRQLLIKAIHSASVRFPEVAGTAVSVLSDFLADTYGDAATDVIIFVREVCERYENLRSEVLKRVLFMLPSIRNASVVRGALWVLGSYSEQPQDVKEAFQAVLSGVGRLPLTNGLEEDGEGEEDEDEVEKEAKPAPKSKRPTILADGTYASQIAETELVTGAGSSTNAEKTGPPIRSLLMAGEYVVGVAVCTMLTKLVLRVKSYDNAPPVFVNRVRAEAMLVCASLLKFGKSHYAPVAIDDGSAERIISCITTMNGETNGDIWLESSREAFHEVIRVNEERQESAAQEKAKKDETPVEEVIDFRLLRSRRTTAATEADVDVDEMALTSATTGSSTSQGFQLSRITQLTGMSDPVYAEAHITVHQYDIILDVLVINTTNDTLQNLTLELATMGDLRLCERPQSYTLGPGDRKTIRANIKVSSTETGIIFGNIVYDVAGAGSASGCVILNDIHVDVMDYIEPGEVSDTDFRSMWAEFEWENKVAVNTTCKDLSQFLDFVTECTNMRCLTLRGIEEESGYLAANLYARSVFGEDALVNLSVEKAPDGSLAGYIRIRSKTQGIALSLGDKITLKQSQKQGPK
ncbi:unnamed protein product [Chondrus crispus]|uniref:Coatomer subunit beta n=1 Tax=Chondrus crispus TaxID=2769 RepID=R7Q8T5_CHOCR|nr:unnamed protein product [Chondrus crispus]CDF34449.1 unnamed protein product [Chondrus crispus]|eukprot:XP_005714268.1 unnamed protein product [Chondrus crispus]